MAFAAIIYNLWLPVGHRYARKAERLAKQAPIFPKASPRLRIWRPSIPWIYSLRSACRTFYRAQPMLFALTGRRALRVANEARTGCRVSFPSINNGEPATVSSQERSVYAKLLTLAKGAASNAAGWVWLQWPPTIAPERQQSAILGAPGCCTGGEPPGLIKSVPMQASLL
jgi:hypothetical protein